VRIIRKTPKKYFLLFFKSLEEINPIFERIRRANGNVKRSEVEKSKRIVRSKNSCKLIKGSTLVEKMKKWSIR